MTKTQPFSESKIEMSVFRHILFVPLIDLADVIDYTGRPILLTMPYLRKHNLLPFFPKGKWHLKISIAQLIWLRVIDTLRQFSYKVADMQKLCDYFFKDAYENNLAKEKIRYNIEMLNKKKVAGTITGADDQKLETLQMMEKDENVSYGLKLEINYLTDLIIQCIDRKEDTGILVFAEGKVLEYDSNGYGNHKKEFNDPTEPHIRLSIKHYLKEFIDDDELSELIMPQILNEDETRILQEVRNRNVSEIIVKKSNNGELRIDTAKNFVINGERAKELRRILGLGNYEEITMTTRDAKTLTFKKLKKNINSD